MRKRMIAGVSALVVFGAGAGAAGTIGYDHLTAPGAKKTELVTPGRVFDAARMLTRDCLDPATDGTTTQSGSREGRLVISRSFTGKLATGISCQVVEMDGRITRVSVTGGPNSDASPTNGTTTETLYYRDALQTGVQVGKENATSWGFETSNNPDDGPAVAIGGYADTFGGRQVWAYSARNGQVAPGDASFGSLNLSNGPGADLSTAVFNTTVADATYALRLVHREDQGPLPTATPTATANN